MAKRKKPGDGKTYSSEAELCSEFMDAARALGFTVYPETANFDLVLCATETTRDKGVAMQVGDQIGVQAKLRANLEVLEQVLPERNAARAGPTHYAVLVPYASESFHSVAKYLRVNVFEGLDRGRGGIAHLPGQLRHKLVSCGVLYAKPCWLPEVEVVTPAGVASPRSITPWKMAAVRLAMLGLLRGYLLGTDFVEHKIRMQLWLRNRWIVAKGWAVHEKRRVKYYEITDSPGVPHRQYPEIYEALLAGGKFEP